MQGSSHHGNTSKQEVSPGSAVAGASGTEGPAADMAQLLRQVFRLHQSTLDSSLSQYKTLKSKYGRLSRERDTVYDHGKHYQEKYDALLEENRSLREEASRLKDRLCEPCRQCDMFQKQLAQQEDIYHRAYSLLLQEKDNTIARLEKRLEELYGNSSSSRVRIKEQGRSSTKSLQNTQKARREDLESLISQAIAAATQEVMAQDPLSESCVGREETDTSQTTHTKPTEAETKPAKSGQKVPNTSKAMSVRHSQQKTDELSYNPNARLLRRSQHNAKELSCNPNARLLRNSQRNTDELSCNSKAKSLRHQQIDPDGMQQISSIPGQLKSHDQKELSKNPNSRSEAKEAVINSTSTCSRGAGPDGQLNRSDPKLSSEEESPNSLRARNLKLTTKGGKRTRCRYTEDPLPDSKKARVSDQDEKLPSVPLVSATSPETQTMLQKTVVKVLVHDTCDPHSQVPKATHGLPLASSTQVPWQHGNGQEGNPVRLRNKKTQMEKPDITVPETVPFDAVDVDEFEEDDTGSPGSRGDTVQHAGVESPAPSRKTMEASSPGLLSSAVSGVYCNHDNYDETRAESLGEELLGVGHSGERPSTRNSYRPSAGLDRRQISSTDSTELDGCCGNGAQSPVFEGSHAQVAREEILVQNTRSPSLFDEDSGDHSETGNAESVHANRTNCVSNARKCLNSDSEASRHDLQRKIKTRGRITAKDTSMANISSVSNPGANHKMADLSVASNPSPSVLSGKVVKASIIEGGASPSLGKTKARITVRDSKMRSLQSVSGEAQNENLVPNNGRKTRSQTTPLSQESKGHELDVLDIVSSDGKRGKGGRKFVQTTLSPSHFQPKRTVLSRVQAFNGGRLQSSQELTVEEQERLEIEEATKRSLEDFTARPGDLDLVLSDLTSFVDPQMTSTPHVGLSRHKQVSKRDPESPSVFVKPRTPPKTPCTPEKRQLQRQDDGVRRSPRLHKQDKFPTSPQGQRLRTSLTKRSLEDTYDAAAEGLYPGTVPADLNGSLDPNIRLSEYDTTLEERPMRHSQIESTGETLKPYIDDIQPLEAVSFFDIDPDGEDCEDTPAQKSQILGHRSRSQRRGRVVDEDSQDIELSKTSVVFGPSKASRLEMSRAVQQGTTGLAGADVTDSEPDIFSSQAFAGKDTKRVNARNKGADKSLVTMCTDDSFDRVPQKASPGYAYVDVVRKQAARRQLQAYVCQECDEYFSSKGLTGEEKAEAMKACKHRARYLPPGTPEHYWSIGFPDTQECEERGYLNKTQAKPSKSRRRKPYAKLFTSEKEEDENTCSDQQENDKEKNILD